jgi:hypothetical protein
MTILFSVLAFIWVLHALAAWRALPAFGWRTARIRSTGNGEAAAKIDGSCPWVSVIVPCRDEGDSVDASLRTLLDQDWPRLEIIVVDDRSTDGSPEVLARLAAREERLKSIRIDDLPPAWLGKCHALNVGARAARGDWLVFSDADVRHDPTHISRAMAMALERDLDLFSTLPVNESKSPLMVSIFGFVYMTAAVALGYWAQGRRRGSLLPVAAGAFTLVRRTAYDTAGGHTALRLSVVDDIALAVHLRSHGFRTECRYSEGLSRLAYAPTYRDFVRVTEKNAFALLGYRVSAVLFTGAMTLLLNVVGPLWPLIAPAAWIPGIAVWIGIVASWWPYAGLAAAPKAACLAWPIIAVLSIAPNWNSMLKTLWRGGVRWRDREYPLAELRAWETEQARARRRRRKAARRR